MPRWNWYTEEFEDDVEDLEKEDIGDDEEDDWIIVYEDDVQTHGNDSPGHI